MMSTHDRLLTNTTNRLSLVHEDQSSTSSATPKPILMPTPIHPSTELSFLAKRNEFLEKQIA